MSAHGGAEWGRPVPGRLLRLPPPRRRAPPAAAEAAVAAVVAVDGSFATRRPPASPSPPRGRPGQEHLLTSRLPSAAALPLSTSSPLVQLPSQPPPVSPPPSAPAPSSVAAVDGAATGAVPRRSPDPAGATAAAGRPSKRPWYGTMLFPAGGDPPVLPVTAVAAPPVSAAAAGLTIAWPFPWRNMRLVRAAAAVVAAATLVAVLLSAPVAPAGPAIRPTVVATAATTTVAAAAAAVDAAGGGEASPPLPPPLPPPSVALPFRAGDTATAPTAGDALSSVAPPSPPIDDTTAIDGTRCDGSSACLDRWKAFFITALFVEGVAGGLAPSGLRLLANPERALHVANAFSGGVFFATGMLHVLPEAVEHLDRGGYSERAGGTDGEGEEATGHEEEGKHHDHFPLAYALTLCGFYSILFIERLVVGNATDGHVLGPGHSHGACVMGGMDKNRGYATVADDGDGAAGLIEDGDGGIDGDGPSLKLSPSALSFSSGGSFPSAAFSGSSHGQLREVENVGFFSPNFSRALVAAASVAIHSLFESLSLGLADNWLGALNTCLAIAAHKWATSVSLGVKFEKERLRQDQIAVLVLTWAGVTPASAWLGAAIGGGGVSDTVTGVLLALSAGIFLYIAFEVTLEEFAGHPKDRAVKVAAAVGGAAAIMVITAVLIRAGLH